MPDVFTKAKRSDVMSRIRSRGNADTELALVRLLRAHKITGWRRHVRIAVDSSGLMVDSKKRRHVVIRGRGALLRGPKVSAARQHRPTIRVRPDFVFRKARLALFVDGCFWHGCPKHGTKPKGNAAFWRKKFASNIGRDRLVTRTLRRAGWRVLRIWEHELKRGREDRRWKMEDGSKRGVPVVVRRILRLVDG